MLLKLLNQWKNLPWIFQWLGFCWVGTLLTVLAFKLGLVTYEEGPPRYKFDTQKCYETELERAYPDVDPMALDWHVRFDIENDCRLRGAEFDKTQ